MTIEWNPHVYAKFLESRTRPARDLLAAFPVNFQPKLVYDLGCGPGNSTALLKARWPEAVVIGLDNASAMIEEAKQNCPDISFIKADIESFSPDRKADCLFANASLHWLPNHETLFPKLFAWIAKEGMFGIQMPNNFHLPGHQAAIHVLEKRTAWRPLLGYLLYGKLSEPFYKLDNYYHTLAKAGVKEIQLWETTYFHEMETHQDIFDWLKGTALQSVLFAMDLSSKIEFQREYLNALAAKYPVQFNNKILFPFHRIFLLGRV